MESLHAIKARRTAVRSIGQITKAMEVVAATKMRKAQELALASRPFAQKSLELLARLNKHTPLVSPLAEHRPVRTILYVIISSDRGLAGSFNAQVFRKTDEVINRNETDGRAVAIAIGKKAGTYAMKRRIETIEMHAGFGDFAEPADLAPTVERIISGFRGGAWDRVIVISTHFRTTLVQEVIARWILPIDIEAIRETIREIIPEHGRFAELATKSGKIELQESNIDFLLEPSAETIADELVPELVRTQFYHLMLEANASEHSARRVAMKNASDNATELERSLTIEFNKARQAGITTELIEITGTQSAMVA